MAGEHLAREGVSDDILLSVVVAAYEQEFAGAPDRAQVAQRRAKETLALFLDSLGYSGLYLDEPRLLRVLEWAAFDYSVPDATEGVVAVGRDTLVGSLFAILNTSDGGFPSMLQDMEDRIVAMHIYRQHVAPDSPMGDPTTAFVSDYVAVCGSTPDLLMAMGVLEPPVLPATNDNLYALY